MGLLEMPNCKLERWMSTTKPDPIRHLWLMHTPGLVWLRPLSALENKPPTVEISRHRFSISYTNLMWSWPSGACSWLHFWLWSLLWPHLHVLTSPSSQQSDHGFPLCFLAQQGALTLTPWFPYDSGLWLPAPGLHPAYVLFLPAKAPEEERGGVFNPEPARLLRPPPPPLSLKGQLGTSGSVSPATDSTIPAEHCRYTVTQ